MTNSAPDSAPDSTQLLSQPSLPSASLWQEVDLFFMQQGKVYETLRRLAKNLPNSGIDYVVIDGMALVIHGYVRLTQDVDIIMSETDLDRFRQTWIGRGYGPAFPGATRLFRDAITGVQVEVVMAGEFPGDGKPKPVQFSEPGAIAVEQDGLRVVRLESLIELKLASGLTAPDRLKDLADIQELIRILNLPQQLAEQLDPSVREEYLRLWRTVQPSA